MNSTDILGGSPLVSCPPYEGNLPPAVMGIYSPAITFTFTLQTVSFACFSILIALKYSRVRIFNRNIKNRYISNNLWIWYFLFLSIVSLIEALRYGLNLPYYKTQGKLDPNNSAYWNNTVENLRNADSGLVLTGMILRLLSFLLLSLALRWQIRYRSGGIPLKECFGRENRSRDFEEEDSLLDESNASSDTLPLPRQRRKPKSLIEKSLIATFLVSIAILYLNVMPFETLAGCFFLLFISVLLLQHVIVWLLATGILVSRTSPSSTSAEHILSLSTTERLYGPTSHSKTLLVIGMILTTIGSILPPNLLVRFFYAASTGTLGSSKGFTETLESTPVMDCYALFKTPIYSLFDVFQLVSVFGGFFLFLFVRWEFNRVKEQCIWWTVRRVTGTFGFFTEQQ